MQNAKHTQCSTLCASEAPNMLETAPDILG
jgi:hypothetical protein